MIDVKINGRNLEIFNAHMLEYTVDDSAYHDGYVVPSSRMIPVKLRSRIGLRAITMTLDFEGESPHEIALNISNFTAMLRAEAHLLLPDGFYYWCEFDKASAPKEKAPWISQVQFSMTGFRHGSKSSVKLKRGVPVNIEGNYETPAIVTVTPHPGVTEFTILGIVVKNVTGTVTIDGVRSLIQDENGKNKFGDAPSMTSWPMLQPGTNQVEMSDGIDVVLTYYPIYQ